jgi:V/A-type H+/Na+-transporting ATPase subunit D
VAKRIAPTKGNLILVKEELVLAQEAYELLDRKREVLINELMRYMHELREVQDRFHEKFVKALFQFRLALARMGQADMNKALDFPMVENEFNILHRSVMGVHVLELSIEKPATQPMPGPAQSTPELEEAAALMREALDVLGDYVTRIGSVWRLANEVKKTQRRVNALEYIFIPDYRQTRDYIQAVLEENEREEFFRQKRVKSKLARSR